MAIEVDGPAAAAPEHLTLRFLGDVPESQVPDLIERLRPVAAATPPFEIELSGVDAFPSRERPRVVWTAVTRGREEAVSLMRRVAEALRPTVGSPEADEPVPHLTLFRVRRPADRERARRLLEGTDPAPPPRSVQVREFVLKESRLSSEGAVHRTVARFPLGAAAPA